MSLFKSKSKRAFQHNMETEMDSGKPKAQSLAIAYNVKRKSSKKAMAEGGDVKEESAIQESRPTTQEEVQDKKEVMQDRKKLMPKKQPKMAEITGPFKVKMRDEQDEDPQMLNDGGIVDTIKAAFEDDPKPKSAPTPVPTPNPDNIKKYGFDKLAEGGEVHDMYDSMDEEELEHHSSIAAAIMAKRDHEKMMAAGGQVDIDENETEESANPSTFSEMNEEAPEHDFDSDMDSEEQPEDSNEQGDDIESDKHDRIAEIRKRRKKSVIEE